MVKTKTPTERHFWFISNADAPPLAGRFELAASTLPDITDQGRNNAILMGRALKRALKTSGGQIEGVYSARAKRSLSTAGVVLGAMGSSEVIRPIDALDQATLPAKEVRERITGWAIGLKKPGLYIATLSRRALTALVSDVFEEYRYLTPGEDGYIPPASLTDVTLSSGNDMIVDMFGMLPDEVEERYGIIPSADSGQ